MEGLLSIGHTPYSSSIDLGATNVTFVPKDATETIFFFFNNLSEKPKLNHQFFTTLDQLVI